MHLLASIAGCLVLGSGLAAPSASLQAAPDGWTVFAASADTRKVFVSSARGDDRNDGLSAARPKRTLAAGRELLRHGFPDWLLLERGGTWHESLGQWKKSGRSAREPMLVSSYGAAAERPLIETGTAGGIWTHGGGGSPATIDDLAIVGLRFRADGYAGGGDCIGAQFLQPASHVLIEDCLFEGYSTNLVFQGVGGRHADFRVRRSVIVDAYTVHEVGGHSQGLYANKLDGLVLEENVFDHDGWSERVPGAGADIFSHDVYVDNDNTGVVVRGNVIARASSHGMQLRCGGTVVDNLFVGNSIALSVGGGNEPNAGGVTADVRGNVVIEGKDIDAATPRGWGMWFANIASGRVAQNLIAHNDGRQPRAVTLEGRHAGDTRPSGGIHGLVLERNVVYDWGGVILVRGDASCFSGVELVRNDARAPAGGAPVVVHEEAASAACLRAERNRFHQGPESYPDAQRSLARYARELGGEGTTAAFLQRARAQSKASWRPELTAASANRWLRAGFALEFE